MHKPKNDTISLPPIEKIIRGEGFYIRQSSSIDCYGHVILQLEPNPNQDGCFMLWSVVHNPNSEKDSIPDIYCADIYQGLCEAFTEVLPDESSRYNKYIFFPYENTNVRIIGGSYNAVDSRGMCYRIAVARALLQAMSYLKID